MKKVEPRYLNNLFVSDEKNLTRTINTYIEYESVKKLYLSFNTKVDKFEIHPIIGIDFLDSIEGNILLVYDRGSALINRTNTDKIIAILKSYDMKELYSQKLLDEMILLVKEYEYRKPLNSFFEEINKEKVLLKLENMFSYIKGTYIQKQSGNEVQNSKMVSKRFYNTLLNKLNYQENISNKLSSLKYQVKTTQKDRLQRVQDELDLLKEKIEYLKFLRSREYDKGVENLYYNDVLIAVHLFHDEKVRRDFAEGYDYFELLQEKQVHEDNMTAEVMEHNNYVKFHSYVKEAIRDLFYEYIKLSRYVKVDKLRFTKIGIEQSFEQLSKKIKNSSKLGGAKRRTRILQLQKDYGVKYKDFFKVFSSLSDERRQFLLKKVLLLNKHKRLLSELEIDFIEDIFNDNNVSFEYESELKEYPEIFVTIEEHKEAEGYYKSLDEIKELKNELYEIWEYINDEIESDFNAKIKLRENKIEDLNILYHFTWEYPKCVQDYLDGNYVPSDPYEQEQYFKQLEEEESFDDDKEYEEWLAKQNEENLEDKGFDSEDIADFIDSIPEDEIPFD